MYSYLWYLYLKAYYRVYNSRVYWIEKEDMQEKELRNLAKVELHCHLDGSLTLESVSELLNRRVSSSELMVADDCKDLKSYLEKFELPLKCLQTYDNLKKATREFLLSLVKDNIKYVEVRFAPMLSVNEKLSCRNVIEAVLSGLEDGRKICDIDYNVIACTMRHHTAETNMEMLKIAREFLDFGLCATDLAGNEAAYPMGEFKEVFNYAKKINIPFTIHAGECGNSNNIKEAIELGARRIGHGIAMRGNEEIKTLCLKNRIGIEMCPISNMQTKAIDSLQAYPLREFLDKKLLLTINTDNITVSNTSLTKEFLFIQNKLNISDEEIHLLRKNSIEVAFANDDVKNKLYKML